MICGQYHPPKPRYIEDDLISYLTDIFDLFLDGFLDGTVLIGGDLNNINLHKLSAVIGLTALVFFPTRGTSILGNCLTNNCSSFSKSYPVTLLIKTDHRGVIVPAGAKLKPMRYKSTMHDYGEHRKIAFHAKLLEQSWDVIFDREDVWNLLFITCNQRSVTSWMKNFKLKPCVCLCMIHDAWLRWPRLNAAAQMDAQLILKKQLMQSLQKIVNRLQVERWARRPNGKRSMRCQREKKDPTQALTRTLWENWIIIMQIYVMMKIISDLYPWTSRKTFLHQNSHWARFPTLCSKQSKHLLAQIIYHTGSGRRTLPYWQYPQHKQSGTYPWQTQRWPSAWKRANVYTLPKVDIPVQPQDFRGICVTSVIARTFVRVVYNTLVKKVWRVTWIITSLCTERKAVVQTHFLKCSLSFSKL